MLPENHDLQEITGSDHGAWTSKHHDFQGITYDVAKHDREQLVSRSSGWTKDASQHEQSYDEDVVNALRKRESHYIKTIDHLTKQIDVLKRSSSWMKREWTTIWAEKMEIKAIFKLCLEEVQAEILKRKWGQGGESLNAKFIEEFTTKNKVKAVEMLLSDDRVL